MSSYKATLPRDVRERRDLVMKLWATHHGWPEGGWPKDRRHDAIQIQHWVRLLALPMDFWVEVIGRVPKGGAFRFLTTPPAPGRVSRLEQLSVEYLQRRREEAKREADRTAEQLGQHDPAAKARVDKMVGQLAGKLRMRPLEQAS